MQRRPIKIVELIASATVGGTERHTVATVATRENAERWIARERKYRPWRVLLIVGGK